jgi:dsRNA-specific ribonuclease
MQKNPTQNQNPSPPRSSLTSKLLHAEEFMPSEDGGLIFNPYNPENCEITLSEIQSILTAYGVPDPKVHNIELYKRAFVHQSYTRRPEFENAAENISVVDKPEGCMPLRTKSNERLEFIGDGVLECVTKYCLYRRFPKENEGFMTEKKIAIVKNETIGRMAYEMGLHRWFITIRLRLKTRNTGLRPCLPPDPGSKWRRSSLKPCLRSTLTGLRSFATTTTTRTFCR